MNPLYRWPGAYRRRMAKWLGRRPYRLPTLGPTIAFTFDDFPRSSLLAGGAILETAGLAGTYFTSFGLMAQTTPTGEIFHREDLDRLTAGGHELGCHTYNHYPAWETEPKIYEASVVKNKETATSLLTAEPMTCHSYPISYPRPATKRRIAKYFTACRGGGQCINTGTVDLNYLSSFFIEQCRGNFAAIEQIVTANAEAGGWLIFSTHDVCASPTRFGCTPAFFEQIVACSVRSGATILPMGTALQRITGRPAAPAIR